MKVPEPVRDTWLSSRDFWSDLVFGVAFVAVAVAVSGFWALLGAAGGALLASAFYYPLTDAVLDRLKAHQGDGSEAP